MFSPFRLELRIRFVPQSSYEFMLTDAKAFVYLHKQVRRIILYFKGYVGGLLRTDAVTAYINCMKRIQNWKKMLNQTIFWKIFPHSDLIDYEYFEQRKIKDQSSKYKKIYNLRCTMTSSPLSHGRSRKRLPLNWPPFTRVGSSWRNRGEPLIVDLLWRGMGSSYHFGDRIGLNIRFSKRFRYLIENWWINRWESDRFHRVFTILAEIRN